MVILRLSGLLSAQLALLISLSAVSSSLLRSKLFGASWLASQCL